MKKMTCFVMALALVLGLAQCKKEQPQSEGNVVMITLNVDGGASTGSATNGSRAEVDPPHVSFEDDDQILVASGGKYVGTLTRTEGVFSGNITDPVEGQRLYFYFLGNKVDVETLTPGTTDQCTVNISDQTDYPHLPVISMGKSMEDYASGTTSYTSRLYNKASLMKFNVVTPSTAPICITGMNNTVTVDFGNPTDAGFEYGMDGDGVIKMHGVTTENTETWAIVLPQAALAEGMEGTAYSEDGNYIGSRSAIELIESNKFYDEDIRTVTVTTEAFNPYTSYLTFEAKQDGATVRFVAYNKQPIVEYSTNGTTWESRADFSVTVNNGQKVYFRAVSPNSTLASTKTTTSVFRCTGQFYVYGNIMSLLDKDNFATPSALESNYTFSRLFKDNTYICSHPTKALVLPATSVKQYSYYEMFYGCTSLTTAPELPATTLDEYCYNEMFYNCTSLTTAPSMSATTMAKYSCKSMFYGCTNLTTVPTLVANTLADYCYNEMFRGCTSLTAAPNILATTVAQYSCSSMFNGCTSLTTAPAILPAPVLVQYCYYYMFNGCSSLTSAPELPATTLARSCYDGMFYGCNSLSAAPELQATELAPSCYSNMFRGCSSLTTAPELPATTLENACYLSMFYNCSNLTTAPELPAATLKQQCYGSMFNNCSSLNSITCLAIDISATNCLNTWVNGVAATGTFYKAAGVTWPVGSNGIPTGWTVQEHAPEGAIDGLFSVSATQQVWFSQGNLQATTTNNGNNWSWSFATNQYDYVGNAAANNTINGNGTVSTNGSIDLFSWSTGANFYGINNSTVGSDYSGSFVDWGNIAISNGGNTENSGWRTLTIDEWSYLFNSRTDAASKKGLGSVNGVNGMILLPDVWTLPEGLTFAAVNSSWANVYTTQQWALMEANGAIFLPALGARSGTTVNNLGARGDYWTSSAGSNTENARSIYFQLNRYQLDTSYRRGGRGVRLVRNVQ